MVIVGSLQLMTSFCVMYIVPKSSSYTRAMGLGLKYSIRLICPLRCISYYCEYFLIDMLARERDRVILLLSRCCRLTELLVRELVRLFLLDCVPSVPDRVIESDISVPCGCV